MDHRQAYALVSKVAPDYTRVLKLESRQASDVERLRRVCEMVLVREYNNWYAGDPKCNVSKASHTFCHRLAYLKLRPPEPDDLLPVCGDGEP